MSPGGLDSVATGLGPAVFVGFGALAEGLAPPVGADGAGVVAEADDVAEPEVVDGTGAGLAVTAGVEAGPVQAEVATMMAAARVNGVTEVGDNRMMRTLRTPRQAEGEPKVNVRLPSRRVALRRRVTAAIVTVTAAAVVVFAAPLAYAVHQLYRNEELATLQRDAVRIAAIVPDTPEEALRQIPPRPAELSDDVRFGVYDVTGKRLGGDGPELSALAASAADGQVHSSISGGYSVSAPVPSDGVVGVTVLTTSSGASVGERTRSAWGVMAALAAVILALAAAVARWQARRLSMPLERLTAAARSLGDGDFTIRPDRSGIVEADDAAEALARTAIRLGQLRERERSFARDASHQLRTPLAGLLLGLENALGRERSDDRTALERALQRGRRLETIIDDLLALTRPGGSPTTVLQDVLRDTEERWHGVLADLGRRLVVRVPPGATRVAGPAAAVRQILDVLVGNALRHGAGTVTVEVAEIPDGVALLVADEGDGLPPIPGLDGRRGTDPASTATPVSGLGLTLARDLAAGIGALLDVPPPGRPAIFRLLIPTGAAAQDAGS
ncbi:MAG: two-component sensor histidine kinase [Frankiales bacterium]|nr:two-component sensor histidine kinase [Frankiales bacterium]